MSLPPTTIRSLRPSVSDPPPFSQRYNRDCCKISSSPGFLSGRGQLVPYPQIISMKKSRSSQDHNNNEASLSVDFPAIILLSQNQDHTCSYLFGTGKIPKRQKQQCEECSRFPPKIIPFVKKKTEQKTRERGKITDLITHRINTSGATRNSRNARNPPMPISCRRRIHRQTVFEISQKPPTASGIPRIIIKKSHNSIHNHTTFCQYKQENSKGSKNNFKYYA